MHLKILKISQGEKEVWLGLMDDKRIRVLLGWGLLSSDQLEARCRKVRNYLTSAQVTSDPGYKVKVMWGG